MSSTTLRPTLHLSMRNILEAICQLHVVPARLSIIFITVHPHPNLPPPPVPLSEGEEYKGTMSIPRPWWEGLGEGVNCYSFTHFQTHIHVQNRLAVSLPHSMPARYIHAAYGVGLHQISQKLSLIRHQTGVHKMAQKVL